MAIERIIGIDFGTNTTVVRVKTHIDGKPEGSQLHVESVKFDNHDTLPSLVLWDESYNEYLIGYDAENQFGQAADCTATLSWI